MSCDDIIIEVPEEVIVIEMTPEGADGKDGNGIASIELISTVGLVKTYRITFTDGTHYDYEVEDGEDGAPGPAGNGIASISLISTSGLQKTYRITFTNGGHFDYVVTDGANGAPGADGVGIVSVYKTGTSGLVDTYTILYTNGNTDEFTVTNGAAGATGNGISSVEKIGTVGLVDTYRINFTNGSHYDYTVTNGQDGADPEWGNITGSIADQTDLQNALSEKADIIHTSASGSLVHLTDAGAYPVDSLTVGIEPVQDLHGYDAPWPAGGGKNLFDPASLVGSNATVAVNNNKFTVTGLNAIYPHAQFNLIDFAGKGTFYISCTGKRDSAEYTNNSAVQLFYNDGTNHYSGKAYFNDSNEFTMQDVAIEIPANATTAYLQFYVHNLNSSVAIDKTATYTDVRISATQNTSWSPYSNVCPISGHTQAVVTRTGKNLLQISNFSYGTLNNVTFEELEDGGIWVHGTASANARRTGTVNIAVYKNKAYTFGKWKTQQNINVNSFNAAILKSNNRWTKIASTNNQSVSFTAEEDGVYSTFAIFVASGTQVDNVFYPQLELGSVASAYEAPHVQQAIIDLNGTRYGAQLNVLTGEMTVTKAYLTKNTSTMNNNENFPGWSSSGIRDIIGAGFNASIMYVQSNIAPVSGSAGDGKNYYSANTEGNNDILYLPKSPWGGKTQTQWIADAIDIQLVIPLATPFTVQLSPATMSLLLGENNVWSDTGSTAVGYRADTRLYIERLTQPSEDDMVANTNIASGKYFMIGNNLYLSTASIASGEAIVPGTNCTAMSLADALNAINA